MLSTVLSFGVKHHSGAYVQKATMSYKIQVATIPGSTGNTAVVTPYDSTTSFSVNGSGTMTFTVGANAHGFTENVGGVTIIEDVTIEEGSTAHRSWSYSGREFPNAELVAQ